MKFRNAALLILLVTAPVFNAHAESSVNLASELIRVSRQYQEETVEGRAKLKPALEEIANLSDTYLRDIATSENKPAELDRLSDAFHQVKNLLLNS